MTPILFVLAGLVLASCGGSTGSFDEFVARPAIHTDFSPKSFDFTWLPSGNPVSTTMGPFSLSFFGSPDDATGNFSLNEIGRGSSSGTYSWAPPMLTLNFVTADVGVNTPAEGSVQVVCEADETDGRIRLTNQISGAEATSQKP